MKLVEKRRMSHSGRLAHISLLFLLKFAFALSTDVTVPEGCGLILSCLDAENKEATFRWTFRSRASMLESQVGTQPVFQKQNFWISDGGAYECVTEKEALDNRRVRMSRTYNVSVDKTDITDLNDIKVWQVITVTEGDVANIPCPATLSGGTSTKKDVWVRDTKESTLEPLQPLSQDRNDDEPSNGVYWARPNTDLSIKIYDVKMQDSGMYHCQFGSEKYMVELIVEAPPLPRCFGHTGAWEQCDDDLSRTAAAVMSESLTDFATKLYSHLRKAIPKENILYSPVSIAGVLSHLLLGARNETRTLMEDALCLPRGFSCSHKAIKVLREETQESLDMASQIFYSAEQNLSEAFINQSVEFYEAAPKPLSDDAEKNLDMVNSWVAQKTKNKIPKLLDSVDPYTQLMLINAVYFVGKWKLKFDGNSRPASFTTLDGDMITVPTLYGAKYKLSMQFFNSLNAQVGAFPLTGKNRLFILLPLTSSLKALQAVEERLTDTELTKMAKDMAKVSPLTAEVTLPKLKLDIETDMNRLIGDMGLGELATDPNLCGLFPEQTALPVALSDAHHRASLTLSEIGVEAAAATSLSFARSFPSFSAMQPFIFVLWSDQANCPLFMGRVTRP